MKAKEMPKRLYLFDYNDAMVTPLEGDTVYVKEDAFIEKAVSFIRNCTTYDGLGYEAKCVDIDKFIKAM